MIMNGTTFFLFWSRFLFDYFLGDNIIIFDNIFFFSLSLVYFVLFPTFKSWLKRNVIDLNCVKMCVIWLRNKKKGMLLIWTELKIYSW